MSNTGFSYKFTITNEKFKLSQSGAIKRYKVSAVSAPQIATFQGQPSFGITKWINPYPQIAFEKVVLPQWGNSEANNAYIRSLTITNEPDYIKDYHFIALMRCIDFYNNSEFQAKINCTADCVTPWQHTDTKK